MTQRTRAPEGRLVEVNTRNEPIPLHKRDCLLCGRPMDDMGVNADRWHVYRCVRCRVTCIPTEADHTTAD